MTRQRQLNVRITDAQYDAIQAAVFVRDLRSPQELFEPWLERLAAELMDDADVVAAVALRQRNVGGTVNVLSRARGSEKKAAQ